MNTPNADHQVRLLVKGTDYSGWKSVRITAGIDRQARDFDLRVTDSWPGQTDIPRRIQPGDKCQVFIGQDLVMTGYVDSTPIQYDGNAYSVAVQGRSKTADLVDCCPVPAGENIAPIESDWDSASYASASRPVPAPPKTAAQWRNQKLEAIAAALAAPYGVRVVAQTHTGRIIPEHQVQVGETVFESIDRMMRLRHVLSSDNEHGDLVFIHLGSAGRADSAIETGVNVLAGSADLDYKGVYSDYIVKGQRAGSDDQSGANVSEVQGRTVGDGSSTSSGRASDIHIQRRRLLVIKQSGQVDPNTCQDRAQYESARRAANALSAGYTMAGWRQASGALWRPNLLVHVRDSVIGFDTEMLISECTWTMDEQGLRTDVAIGPIESYVSLDDASA
jgi:prophage tail gpP-like protein